MWPFTMTHIELFLGAILGFIALLKWYQHSRRHAT
jgi:hypothetical protein